MLSTRVFELSHVYRISGPVCPVPLTVRGSVSEDKLLDTALKAVDKLADAFEVKDGNIDDCF